MARRRAETIVAACERYRAAKGRYPDKLSELVPERLPEIPRAKYVLSMPGFHYAVASGSHTLWYSAVSLVGRDVYALEEARWRFVD
jgi:hypothetical protein